MGKGNGAGLGGSAIKRFVLKNFWRGILMWVLISAVYGMVQISAIPLYSSRTTATVGQDRSASMNPLQMFSSGTSVENQLVVLESESARQFAADKLMLTCMPIPIWEPSPLGYNIARGWARLTGGKRPKNYAELDYPSVIELSMNYESVRKTEFIVDVDGNGSYKLKANGSVVDEGKTGETLETKNFKVALNGFTPGIEQKWLLDLSAPNMIARKLYDYVVIFQITRSNAIGVKFLAVHPELAQRVVQAMLDYVMNRDVELRQSSSQNQIKYINDQIATIDNELTELRDEMLSFLKNKDNIIAGTNEADVASGYLSYEMTLSSLQSDLATINAVLTRLRSGNTFVGSLNTSLSSEVTNQLLNNVVSLERDINVQLETKTDQHPDVIASKKSLDEIRKALDNALVENTRQLQNQIKTLNEQLDKYRELLISSPNANVEIKKLEGEIATRTATLSQLYVQLQMANLQAISEESVISLLDPATNMPYPVVPRLLFAAFFSIAVGLFLTLAILFAQSSFDKSVYHEEDLIFKMKANVLASVSKKDIKSDKSSLVRLGSKLMKLMSVTDDGIGIVVSGCKDSAESIREILLDSLESVGFDLNFASDRLIAFKESGATAVFSSQIKDVSALIVVTSPGKNRISELRDTSAAAYECDVPICGWVLFT